MMGWMCCLERETSNFDGIALGKPPLGRPRRKWKGNINTDLLEINYEAGVWRWLRILSIDGLW
jgi:hypothetical protein